jgi:acetyltransferase-like isoleucine patch superfamily enzyme
MAVLNRVARLLARRSKRFERLYRVFTKPDGNEFAQVLKERGDFYAMGDDCYIDPHALIEDRPYIRLGNNVRIATCAILGHDGSVNMINRAFGLHLDNVGKIDIRDNVYIGYGSIILPGVTIGPNAIVSAGSVVRSNVREGDIVAGVPAKRVGRLDMSVEILKARNDQFPWKHLIEKRDSEVDMETENELVKMRVAYFYGEAKPKDNGKSAPPPPARPQRELP